MSGYIPRYMRVGIYLDILEWVYVYPYNLTRCQVPCEL
jgi:hypothetical protein